ncbi:MAG: hypothetical protein M3T96_05810 [Acidobacteriota bacterium]|nr:hypothetical protein [Acidobacteriota bacterium]
MRFRIEHSKFSIQTARSAVLAGCFLLGTLCLFSCGSIPNLEKPECEQSRDMVREFYSVHFGNEMQPSEAYLKLRERFLTADLKDLVSKNLADKRDYFTATDDYPKAFRIGECRIAAPGKTVFGVLLFWKTDTRTEQREVTVETVKQDNKWLVDKVLQQ